MADWNYSIDYQLLSKPNGTFDDVATISGMIPAAENVGMVLLIVCRQHNINIRDIVRFVCAQGN